MDGKHPSIPPSSPAAGDLVVTRVAGHYHVGRKQAEGQPIASIAVTNRYDDAIAIACQLAAGQQRVFLYGKGGSSDGVEIDCTKP
jgi:hypothetical protein